MNKLKKSLFSIPIPLSNCVHRCWHSAKRNLHSGWIATYSGIRAWWRRM